jgi:acetylornithine deacetylase/succinyl-diaminopimelate desuccinylase-like protein
VCKTWRTRRSATRGIDSPTLVIGVVSGGINTNVVPDRVTLRLDRRIVPDETPAEVDAPGLWLARLECE